MKEKKLNFNYEYVKSIAGEYHIPIEDVLLIALNRYGLCANIQDKRIRFKLRLNTYEEVFYLAVCINTYPSPFTIENRNRLCLDGETVGEIIDIEKDTCDATYFRRNMTALTLNSNMRSQCEGCKFCGTYNQDPEDKIDMSDASKMIRYLENFLRINQMEDFRDLVRISICTGCFTDETELVNHILTVYRVFSKFGFTKRIRYIGSQIRSEEAMDIIERTIPYFSLSLTVECFSHRKERMRREKASLDFKAVRDVLLQSLKHGFSTNYLYITGLDDLDVMKKGIQSLSDCVNRFPIIQILQNYLSNQEQQRIGEAKELSYYFKARKLVESVFSNTALTPRSWENYRGLYYLTYQNKPLRCIRI